LETCNRDNQISLPALLACFTGERLKIQQREKAKAATKPARADNGVHEGLPFGGGVWGRCKSPKAEKRLNFLKSPAAWFIRSILVREHQSNGRLRVVHVERAARCNQFHQPGGAV